MAARRFQQVSAQASLVARPFYYTYIDADPKDENVVYVNNLSFWKSTDGGKTWRSLPTPHGDNHGMWINPDNPDIFIQSNDGGANVTLNGGRTWSTQHNQPTAEIYQVAVDDQVPYRLYGAQQDNTTVIVPSLPPTALGVDEPIQYWTQGPGCETGPIMPKIDDPTIVYGSCKGEFSRMNMKVGQEQQRWVHPQNRYGHAARDLRYRFQRVSPMELSPYDPQVIYYGSQFVHRTRDEGVTWETISPDLTAHEPDKQGISGEPITRDITGEEMYSTLYALRESPHREGRDLGRLERRPGARVARRRQDLEERHADEICRRAAACRTSTSRRTGEARPTSPSTGTCSTTGSPTSIAPTTTAPRGGG